MSLKIEVFSTIEENVFGNWGECLRQLRRMSSTIEENVFDNRGECFRQ